MATGDTAAPISLASSPPSLLDRSPSNLSSPLSEVEDKDGEPDEMDLDSPTRDVARLGTPDPEDEDVDDAASEAHSDSESKLSEIDVNDSEAETERLYDTPPKSTPRRGLANGSRENSGNQFIDRRHNTVEPSPSKLKQQVRADDDEENEGSDNDSLSDPDDISIASSEANPDRASADESPPPSPAKDTPRIQGHDAKTVPENVEEDAADTRKRKRSSAAEPPEAEQPRRKRTGSVIPVDREFPADDTTVPDNEAISANAQSGEAKGEDDDVGDRDGARDTKDEAAESVENAATKPSRSKKPKRNGTRKRKSPDDSAGGDEGPSGSAQEDGETAAADEDRPQTTEEEQADADADADEEAELAHKNEEELERKKSAWEELTAIEKQFTNFRERLYQERLDQLNEEEAMLTADDPSHPEYIAMLRCVDERRDEKMRVGKLELELNMGVLKRRAVAERAQILSQYWQSVRESREGILEALGKEWYEIQHERRRCANHVADYGLRFPATKQQTARHAVAYNKEVSVLSGLAKYKGFPAAPIVNGISEDQLDEDFDAIKRAKQAGVPPASTQPFHTEVAAGLPFGGSLGAAGEQFLKQTPWANPNHPSHQTQRQHSDQGQSPAAHLGNRRHSHQPGGQLSSNIHSSPMPNGDSPVPMHKSHSLAGVEGTRSRVVPDGGLKRETILQVS